MGSTLRMLLLDLGALLWAFGGVYFWLQDIRQNGYHWFRTPMTGVWLMITFWALFFQIAGDLNDQMKKDEAEGNF